MIIKRSRLGPSNRLEIGTAILTAANLVDTKSVKGRLDPFSDIHRAYTAAQRRAEAIELQIAEQEALLLKIDAEQDHATEVLAGALVYEGQPRANPFAAFGTAAPSLVKKLVYAEEAATILTLVAAIQRSKTIGEAVRDAAPAAAKAAHSMQAALLPLQKLEAALQAARKKRDALGHRWDAQLALLKHGARYAEGEGAPGIFDALFGRIVTTRPASKKAKPGPAPEVAPATAEAPKA